MAGKLGTVQRLLSLDGIQPGMDVHTSMFGINIRPLYV